MLRTVLLLQVQEYVSEVCADVSLVNYCQRHKTYAVAAVGANATLTTTQLSAGVALRLANLVSAGLAKLTSGDSAALDWSVVGCAVAQQLGRGASEGRSGDDEAREEHG